MLDNFRLASTVVWRVLFAPLWITWRGYRVLWWAFDSDPRRAGASASLAPRNAPPPPGDAAATPAPTPPTPLAPPIGALRGGYSATLLASLLIALPTRLAVASHHLSPGAGWLTWGWATLAVAVASLFFVRHVAREHAKRQPASKFAQARATLAGVGVACAAGASSARRAAAGATRVGARVGSNAWRASRAAWASAPASRARATLAGFASRLKRPATPAQPAPPTSPA